MENPDADPLDIGQYRDTSSVVGTIEVPDEQVNDPLGPDALFHYAHESALVIIALVIGLVSRFVTFKKKG